LLTGKFNLTDKSPLTEKSPLTDKSEHATRFDRKVGSKFYFSGKAAQREKSERPLRQVMKQTIPFLKSVPGAQNLTNLAIRLAGLWEDPDFFMILSGTRQAIEQFGDDFLVGAQQVDVQETFGWTLSELLGLAPGMRLAPDMVVPKDPQEQSRLAVALVHRAMEALGGHEIDPAVPSYQGAPEWIRAAVIDQRLRSLIGDPDRRIFFSVSLPRPHGIRFVDREEAADFVRRHHSALPQVNFRGALYDLGLEVDGRLVAVATVVTPTGKKSLEKSAHITELSRVASDASVHGAASAIVAKVIELVDDSRRYGTKQPGLLITYSLLSEFGTTYKALKAHGLRPVAFKPAKTAQSDSSSRTKVAAKADFPKIRWEAGADAGPADEALLLLVHPYRKFVLDKLPIENRNLRLLKREDVERLRDLYQALTGSRPGIKEWKSDHRELLARMERRDHSQERNDWITKHGSVRLRLLRDNEIELRTGQRDHGPERNDWSARLRLLRDNEIEREELYREERIAFEFREELIRVILSLRP
jgi:hypothetical protein